MEADADKRIEKQDSSLLETAIKLHEGAREVLAPEAGHQRQMHDRDIERALLRQEVESMKRQVASLTNQLEQANDQRRIERGKLEELNAALSDEREELSRLNAQLSRSNTALSIELQQVKAASELFEEELVSVCNGLQAGLQAWVQRYRAHRQP